MKKLIYIKVSLLGVLVMFFCTSLLAQELNCNVIINDKRVQTQERQIFADMQSAISQFMNTTKWTNDNVSEEERIKCNILITLGKNSTVNRFVADVQIQSLRPVYGTDYETPLLNFFDSKWQFEYNVSQPLIFAENTFTTELTSLLAFYAYVIIGMDYDTFEKGGGTPYYERALNIVSNSEQQGGGPGWTSRGDVRDRYWLSENLNSPLFQDFRDALYIYHRLGMDSFLEDQDESRSQIYASLEKINAVKTVSPSSVMLNAFFDAKAAELVNVFSKGNMELRQKAVDLLNRLDPPSSGDYKKALK
ncbi:DUF4835 family protein [Flammeovirgaceae bacterium SG7u.111]|nr:DUF4835 family protein [Flammeovirgaceae bacterium SG7u.132]WPO36321.1 DUF4835 family protein [Flammeovirgaceae bacterium SG7u.111]